MAEQGREAQLAHQRLGELIEGVRQDHHLEALAQPVDELDGAIERLERGDHFLNVGELQAVLVENSQALLHQHVVVGNVPGSGPEGFDPGFFGEGDPDFRNQHTFKIQTGNFHKTLPFVLIIESSEQKDCRTLAIRACLRNAEDAPARAAFCYHRPHIERPAPPTCRKPP
ncbi:hypothetical protein D3C76_1191070 [compost metagenome]